MSFKLRELPNDEALFLHLMELRKTHSPIHSMVMKEVRDIHAAPFRQACEVLLPFVSHERITGDKAINWLDACAAIEKLKALGVMEEIKG